MNSDPDLTEQLADLRRDVKALDQTVRGFLVAGKGQGSILDSGVL